MTASSSSAWAASMTAAIVSRSSVGMSAAKVPPSSQMILIQSEPSSFRSRMNAGASPGLVSVSTGTPNWVPWPPGAVATLPAEKRSASLPRERSSRAARFCARTEGDVN